jgi:hypothetical protein
MEALMVADLVAVPEVIGRKYERDIDVLLAEEFAVSPQFVVWFLQNTQKFRNAQASVAEVNISKSDSLGESDLVVILERENGGKFALFIEDKVNAPLQPQQEERYHLRADHGMQKGQFDDYEVILCAPEVYVAQLSEPEFIGSRISYEAIAGFFRSCDPSDRRLNHRARFIETAIPKSASIWKRHDDPLTNLFWNAAYEIAHNEFPELEMKPLGLTKDSTWINFRTFDMPTMPQRIYVSFKGDHGQMDLTFTNTRDYLLKPRVQCLLEEGMDLVQTGKSAAIRLSVDGFKVREFDDAIRVKLRAAFAACVRLIRFYRKHHDVLITSAAESQPIA